MDPPRLTPGVIKDKVLQYTAGRPFMPGYEIAREDEGGGLLPWYVAEQRITQSRHYWIATLWPDGRPHLTTVWGAWNQNAFWFSAGTQSRKAKNLAANPAISVSTSDESNPVVIDGEAELIDNRALVAIFLARLNMKYKRSYTLEFMDPKVRTCYRVKPKIAIGLEEDNLTGSPTRWQFET